MKLKRNALIVLILGVLMSVSGLVAPIVYWSNYTSKHGMIGIIGGAEVPTYPFTYTFMLSTLFDGLPFVLILLGVSLIVSSVFCLAFSKTVRKHCNINTSALSLGLSSVGALGLICAFLWFIIVSFGETSKHPIQYPLSIMLGMICFFTFFVLIAMYFKMRRANWSIKGFVIDILTSVIYLPVFFFVFSYLYGILS